MQIGRFFLFKNKSNSNWKSFFLFYQVATHNLQLITTNAQLKNIRITFSFSYHNRLIARQINDRRTHVIAITAINY